ncbi:MAG: hypothetical protein PHH60_04000, partial [Candidatus Margulisbacteria bacterium]|nr:hypothetical protein [Candidatus Margulisiibacteriota bacterium]
GESRGEVELNTAYQIVKLFGLDGKLLLGVKYFNLNSSTAPTSFTGLNIGGATAGKVLGRDVLLRAFYSYPVSRANSTASALGQPNNLLDYEISVEQMLFSYPTLIGFSGEYMSLSAGFSRYYNNFFVRYFL